MKTNYTVSLVSMVLLGSLGCNPTIVVVGPTPTVSPTVTPTPAPTPTVTPIPTVTPTSTPTSSPVSISAVWANEGGDKVTQDELRVSVRKMDVRSSIWDGTKVKLFGAKNEVVNFNLVLEAATQNASAVSVRFDTLTGPGGAVIRSVPVSGNGVFDWTQRNIELFLVRYLQIKGLSHLSYDHYDERHIPNRLRRPFTGAGIGSGNWSSRPDHDKYYPDIAVPAELAPDFQIARGANQSIWADIYIPKSAAPGVYVGIVTVLEGAHVSYRVPVELTVRKFALPDAPASKTMAYLGFSDVNQRYTGVAYPNAGTAQDALSKQVRDRHFLLAHRHKISMIDSDNGNSAWNQDAPRPEWTARLSGALFTAAQGYDGPGVGTGNGVYSIGTYGSWSWKNQGQTGMQTHTNAWEQWFASNSPLTERFLYLIDESTNYTQTEQWAGWLKSNPGIGHNLKSFATIALPSATAHVPSLDIATSWMAVGDTASWQQAADRIASSAGKYAFMYNGKRPASGSFATEDDGVALRELAWGQYKKGIHRWFFWESTYYNDYQNGRGQTNVFQTAQTFGGAPTVDAILGESGYNHSNGDGVLFYPGTDRVFPAESIGIDGPLASLRLKHWRRGIQDVDYIALAMARHPGETARILNAMVPKALWEYGIADPNDPTWQRTDISWATDPNAWEAARASLADLIEN